MLRKVNDMTFAHLSHSTPETMQGIYFYLSLILVSTTLYLMEDLGAILKTGAPKKRNTIKNLVTVRDVAVSDS